MSSREHIHDLYTYGSGIIETKHLTNIKSKLNAIMMIITGRVVAVVCYVKHNEIYKKAEK